MQSPPIVATNQRNSPNFAQVDLRQLNLQHLQKQPPSIQESSLPINSFVSPPNNNNFHNFNQISQEEISSVYMTNPSQMHQSQMTQLPIPLEKICTETKSAKGEPCAPGTATRRSNTSAREIQRSRSLRPIKRTASSMSRHSNSQVKLERADQSDFSNHNNTQIDALIGQYEREI